MTRQPDELIHPTYRHLDRAIRLAGLPLAHWAAIAASGVGAWLLAKLLPLPSSVALSIALTLTGTPVALLLATGGTTASPVRVLRARARHRKLTRTLTPSAPLVAAVDEDGTVTRTDGTLVRHLEVTPRNPLVLDPADCQALTAAMTELILRTPAGQRIQLYAHAIPVDLPALLAATRTHTTDVIRRAPDPGRAGALRALAVVHERSLATTAADHAATTVRFILVITAADSDELDRTDTQLRSALTATDQAARPLTAVEVRQLLAARHADVSRDVTDHRHVAVAGGLERTLHLQRSPQRTFYGWLLHAMQHAQPWTLSVHITARDRQAERDRYHRKARRLWGVNQASHAQQRRPDRIQHEQEAELDQLVEELTTGAQTVCDTAIYLTLRVDGTGARAREQLDRLTTSARRDIAAPVDAAFATNEATQADLHTASLPLGLDPAGRTVAMVSRNTADCSPFISTSCGSPTGLTLGTASPGRTIERLDPFDRLHDNATTLVFAKSGGGKTMTTIALASQALTQGASVSVIDRSPGHYAFLCDLLPGSAHLTFHDTADSPAINPWDTPDPRNPPRSKVAFLVRLHALLVGDHDPAEETYGLTALERNLLGLAIRRTYEHAADTNQTPREQLLADTLTALAEADPDNGPVLRNLAQRLGEYTASGTYAHLFDRETTMVSTDAPLLVLNTREIPDDVSDAVLFAQLEHITARVEQRHQHGTALGTLDGASVLILEELWRLLRRRATAAWVIELVRRARHIGLWFIAITQQRSDLAGAHGTALLDNSTIQLFLRNGPDDIAHVADALGLADAETDQIRRLTTEKRSHAQAYVINGQRGRGVVTIRHAPELYWLATSDPINDLPTRNAALTASGYDTAATPEARARAAFAALELLARQPT